jgi:hypothetical protein
MIYRIETLTLNLRDDGRDATIYRVVSGDGRNYQCWGKFDSLPKAEACARERLLNEVLAGRDHSNE